MGPPVNRGSANGPEHVQNQRHISKRNRFTHTHTHDKNKITNKQERTHTITRTQNEQRRNDSLKVEGATREEGRCAWVHL